MIQKFKNFEKDEFLAKKAELKEAVEPEVEVADPPVEDIDTEENEDDIIIGTPVYEDPFLLKISNIVLKRLKAAELGEWAVGYNVIYLDNKPGVRLFQTEGDKTIICTRGTHGKSISIFSDFKIGERNVSIRTYTTETLGFKDMIAQLIADLKPVVGEVVEARGDRYGGGWKEEKEVADFKKLNQSDRDFIYALVGKYGRLDASSKYMDMLESGDKIALGVWTRYRGTSSLEKATNPVKFLIELADTVMCGAKGINVGGTRQKAIDEHILDDLILDYKSAGKVAAPAIVTSEDVEVDTGEEVDELEARRAEQEAKMQAAIEADAAEYEETIFSLRELSEAMCNYVKQGGKLDKDDKSIMSRRGVLITGKGGIGKTYTLSEVLKDKHMILNKDYIWAGSGNSTADSVYQLMYEYNGKMLVFDDSPNLFDGDYRLSMWKNALQTEVEKCLIGYPGKDSKLRVYNVRRLKDDRQKRYFTEIGRKSEEDYNEFKRKEMKKHGLKYSSYSKGSVISEDGMDKDAIDYWMHKIEEMWEDEKANAQPAMPNEFIFTGVVVIISNHERDKFIDEVGKGNWDAISSRFVNFNIAPKAQSLWIVMKKKIQKEFEDESIPDDRCAIPRDMTTEFIEEVESLIVDPQYQSINWRTITMFHDVLSGAPGRRNWKKTLRNELSRK